MINPINWFKGPLKTPPLVYKAKQTEKMEDISHTRNIQEKLASLEVGQLFALATRTGMHVFQKTSIKPHDQVKSKEK